jgi:hypothetical protein
MRIPSIAGERAELVAEARASGVSKRPPRNARAIRRSRAAIRLATSSPTSARSDREQRGAQDLVVHDPERA